jgi:peroxiredoxin Q/BCP
MSQVQLNQAVPDFTLPASSGGNVSLSDYHGRKVLIYFYPKDMTPGCTKESCGFRDFNAEFTQQNTVILGISPDDLASHDQFIAEYKLPFVLLADTEKKVCGLFGVWKQRERNGELVWGVERSTFLIDEKGVLVREWRAVQVDGHVGETLEAVKAV